MTQHSDQKLGCMWWINDVLLIALVFNLTTWVAGTLVKDDLLEKYQAPGQLIDVGEFKMHINCTGVGSPAVILVSGLDDFSITWSLIQPEIAKTTRVCSYDRAGVGWSEESPNSRTSENLVKELHTLLMNANVEGPYVMVGHSFGGALIQLYIYNYPDEVVGFVLVDAAPVNLFVRIPSWRNIIRRKIGIFRALETMSSFGLLALSPENISNRDFPEEASSQFQAISSATDYYKITIAENKMLETNLAEIKAMHITSFGDLPLIVLSRGTRDMMLGLPEAENGQAHQAWNEMQSELLELSSNSRQLVAEKSEHFIQLQQPQLVIDAIFQILQIARKT
jgi:pimeloyl-ACP methyl ester carboxylesterase